MRGRGQRFSIAQVADALQKGAGVPSLAAQILAKTNPAGCSAQTVRNYVARHPYLQAVTNETVETTLDLCEAKLVGAINDSEPWAVRLYLMTKGKNRGYTLRHEVGGHDGKPIEVTDARDKLLAELAEMGERLAAAGAAELGPLTGRANGAARANGAGEADPETIEH
jgi:hypothetical protein